MSDRSTGTRTSWVLLLVAALLGAVLLAVPSGADGADEAGPPRRGASDGDGMTRTTTPPDLFDDVPADHPFYTEIAWLVANHIASGYPDNTFRPTQAVTRQSLAAFIHRYAQPVPPMSPVAPCATPPFPDVPVDHPFCADIAWLADHGVAGGYPDGNFHPTATVSRQTAMAFLQRLEDDAAPVDGPPDCAAAPFPDVPPSSPFCDEITWGVEHGIAGGYPDGGFHPTAAVTRQSSAAFLYRFDQAFGDAPIPSPGCVDTSQGPVTEETRTIDVAGTERSYILTVPTAHDGSAPVPLVLDFHGFGEGAQIHTLMSEFSPIAEREGFVVVFPQGRGSPVFWQTNITGTNPDLTYVDALLATLGDDLCVDLTRVYAAGLSNGAFMTSALGCSRSTRFAAIAPVAGAQHTAACAPERPVPVLAFHGTADPILFFNGGSGPIGGTTTTTTAPVNLHGPGYPANVAAWAAGNGCDPNDVDTPVTDEVLHRVYSCPVGADVEFFIILEGGHAWPGSAFSAAIVSIVGYTTMDIHASEEAWTFFQRFQLPRWTD